MCLARATKTQAVDKLEGAPSSLLATAELLVSTTKTVGTDKLEGAEVKIKISVLKSL